MRTKVKALEWCETHLGVFEAKALYNAYKLVQDGNHGAWLCVDDRNEFHQWFTTDEVAKLAAQAHFDAAIASVLEDDWQTMETARKLVYACHERMASLRDRMGIHYLREHVEREVRDTFEIVRLLSPPAEPNNPSPPKAGE